MINAVEHISQITCCLYNLFVEASVQIFCPSLKIGLFDFLLLSFESSLYILDTSLFQVYALHMIFSPSLWLIFSFY